MFNISRKYYLFIFYFFLGVQLSFNQYTFKKDLQEYGLSLAEISTVSILPLLPWALKCLLGMFSDRYGWRGLHRRPYIVCANFFSIVFSGCLCAPNLTIFAYCGLFFGLQLFTCLSDVIMDASAVEDSRDTELDNDLRGNNQIKNWMFRAFGGLVSVFLGPLVWGHFGSSGVYGFLSGFYSVCFLVSLTFPDSERVENKISTKYSNHANKPDFSNAAIKQIELTPSGTNINIDDEEFEEVNANNSCCFQLGLIRSSLQHPILRGLLIYNVLTGLIPSAGLPLFYFLNDVLMFTPYQFSLLSGFGEVGRLIGMLLYYKVFKRFNIRTLYICVVILAAGFNFLPLFLTTVVEDCDFIQPSTNTTSANETALWGNITASPTSFPHNTTNNNNRRELRVPINSTLYTGNITGACYAFEYYNFHPLGFSIGDDIIGEVLDEIKGMPLNIVASVVCLSSVEGFVYSFNLAVSNFTNGIRRWIDSMMMLWFVIDIGRYENLSGYIAFCATLEFLSLFLFFLLPAMTVSQISQSIREANAHQDRIHFDKQRRFSLDSGEKLAGNKLREKLPPTREHTGEDNVSI